MERARPRRPSSAPHLIREAPASSAAAVDDEPVGPGKLALGDPVAAVAGNPTGADQRSRATSTLRFSFGCPQRRDP